jgi:hypothetical protein
MLGACLKQSLRAHAYARVWSLVCCGLCILAWAQAGWAADPTLLQEDEQRLRVGLKIFPAVLGAMELLDSRAAADGTLQVLVVYQGSAADAREAVLGLEAVGEVRGRRLRVKALSAGALDQYPATGVGGIFVTSVAVGGARLRDWSERLQTLVFSPFAGDLEAGAVAGLYVADRVLPHINVPQARRAGVRFKPFFLKVARTYE